MIETSFSQGPYRRFLRILTISRSLLIAVAVLTASGAIAQTLAPGWTTRDIGLTALPGSTTFGAEAITLSSGGAGVGGNADGFSFAYRRLRGNATIIARFVPPPGGALPSQAGLMVRAALTADSKNTYVFASRDGLVKAQSRTETYGNTTALGEAALGTALWLKLERRATTLTASRSSDGTSWAVLASATVSLPDTVYVGLAVANPAAPGVATFRDVYVIGNGSLDAGFSGGDIGSPGLFGGSWSSRGAFILDGAGTGVAGASDQFRYVSKRVDGDYDLVARLTSFQLDGPSARAGLMVRASTAANAAMVTVLAHRGGGFSLGRRGTPGGLVETAGFPGAPLWLKLRRRGTTLSAFRSVDGLAWTLVGEHFLPLSAASYIGLAVTSSDADRIARANFDNVLLIPVPNTPPVVTLTSPTPGQGGTALSVWAPTSLLLAATATDADGVVAGVDFYDGGTRIGSVTTSPYVLTWSDVPVGSHSIVAVARDNRGATVTSTSVPVIVLANATPFVALSSPSDGATFTAPASILLRATATDPDGWVQRVDFFRGSTFIGSDTTSPYSVTWTAPPGGTHALTAVARDNRGGTTVSSTRDITVTSAAMPTTAVFTPPAGAEDVERYVLEIFPDGADPWIAEPIAARDLGLPPVVAGECAVDIRGLILTLPPGRYLSTVTAVRASGSARSSPSPVFTR